MSIQLHLNTKITLLELSGTENIAFPLWYLFS